MAKIAINEESFIKKCNEELMRHPSYEAGMEFIRIPPPKGTSGESSFSWKGPQHKTAIFAEIARKLDAQYDVKLEHHRR
jgi:hypothetical protein